MPWEKAKPNAGFSDGVLWLPIAEMHFDLAVDQQIGGENSVLECTKLFLAKRKTMLSLLKGKRELVDTPDHVLAFLRKILEQTLLLAFNCSEQ